MQKYNRTALKNNQILIRRNTPAPQDENPNL